MITPVLGVRRLFDDRLLFGRNGGLNRGSQYHLSSDCRVNIIVLQELSMGAERLSDVEVVASDRRDSLLHLGIDVGKLRWRVCI